MRAARSPRSQDTVQLSAEEAMRIEGEHVPLDASAMGAGKIAFMLRFPVGVVAGITPFNAPFNLACHKVAAGDRGRQLDRAQGAAAVAGRRA